MSDSIETSIYSSASKMNRQRTIEPNMIIPPFKTPAVPESGDESCVKSEGIKVKKGPSFISAASTRATSSHNSHSISAIDPKPGVLVIDIDDNGDISKRTSKIEHQNSGQFSTSPAILK